MNKFYFQKKCGFSLVELLVVIGIITILCAIGLPLYSQHVVKSQHVKAEMTLNKLALMLERYYLEHGRYVGAVLPRGLDDGYYRFGLKSSAHHYLLTATPVGKQAQKDECGVMSFDDKSTCHCEHSP